MALATGVVTIAHKIVSVNKLEYIGTIAVGASPLTYATGGIVVSFNQGDLASTSKAIQSDNVPNYVHIEGIAGFDYRYVPGTLISNGLMMILAAGAVSTNAPIGVEHTAAAVVAGVSGDTIRFRAVFSKLR